MATTGPGGDLADRDRVEELGIAHPVVGVDRVALHQGDDHEAPDGVQGRRALVRRWRTVERQMTGKAPIRIVAGEDQPIVREGIVRVLEGAGFEVVGVAADADDLVRKAERTSRMSSSPTSRCRPPRPTMASRRRRRFCSWGRKSAFGVDLPASVSLG